METKLLPCPFCGGEELAVEMLVADYWHVFCDKCRAGVSIFNDDESGRSKAEAIEAWNTRHERTCRNGAASSDYFVCSECDMGVDLYNDYGGFSNYAYGDWNYCPNCGARVKEDADAD